MDLSVNIHYYNLFVIPENIYESIKVVFVRHTRRIIFVLYYFFFSKSLQMFENLKNVYTLCWIHNILIFLFNVLI